MDYEDKIFSVRIKLLSLNYVALFDLFFSNYLGHDLYIQLAYCKKKNLVRISYIDFKGTNKLVKSYYSDSICRGLIKLMQKATCNKSYINNRIKTDKVYLTSYINNQEFEFSRYIPEELEYLEDFFSIVFEYLPKIYDCIFKKLIIKENHKVTYNAYYDGVDFDLFKDEIDKLFEEDIVKSGNKLYKGKKALFLEKFDNRYYAVFKDDIIARVKYDSIEKKLHFGCNCGNSNCEHIHVTLKFIKDKIIFPRFYKLVDTTNTHNILDILQRGEYYLCIGIEDDKFKVIDNKGDIYRLPIKLNDNFEFRILEDESGKLKKEVETALENKHNG